ncbi:MAG: SIMPL domain-containing protein [Deinococcaceae bacterium]
MNKPFPQAFWSVVVVSITLIILITIAFSGIRQLKAKTYSITVTGSAAKTVRSDLAVWTFDVGYSGYDSYASLYEKLAEVPSAIEKFLKSRGIDSTELKVGAVKLESELESQEFDCTEGDKDCVTKVVDKFKLRVKTVERTRYTVSRSFTVESKDVDRVIKASNAYDSLFTQDIYVEDSNLQLLYTGLAQLRLDLVKNASQDAYKRAQLIAEPAGRTISMIEEGRLGVFQITPKNDPSVEDLGNFDTISLEKDVRSTITARYRVE